MYFYICMFEKYTFPIRGSFLEDKFIMQWFKVIFKSQLQNILQQRKFRVHLT